MHSLYTGKTPKGNAPTEKSEYTRFGSTQTPSASLQLVYTIPSHPKITAYLPEHPEVLASSHRAASERIPHDASVAPSL